MSDIVFKDCEYRYVEDGTLCCKDQHNTEKFRGIEDWARRGF